MALFNSIAEVAEKYHLDLFQLLSRLESAANSGTPGARQTESDHAADSVLDLIGNTPLLRLGERIFAKAEFLNPGGSIKDRVALTMIEGAEQWRRLGPDSIIVEPTSRNTGISFALLGRLKGRRARIGMLEALSQEQRS
ncbi:MAG: pyridoxal-phosphate dependent enzyme [Anaerolineae bacterium]|nr:pyridoxal-phosphate dependent enzyme [Anaerolineae bacterium]